MQHHGVYQAQALVINTTKRVKKRPSKADKKIVTKKKVKAEKNIYRQEKLITTNLEY